MSDPIRDDPYYEELYNIEKKSFSTHIAPRRFYVFLEVFMAMLFNFLIYQVGFAYLEDFIPDSNYKGLIVFLANLISLGISVVIALGFIQLVFYKNKMPLKEAEPPLKETTSFFTFKKFGVQLLFALLILFLVYIPLDFLTYSIPGGLEYSQRSLTASSGSEYINFTNFGLFILNATLLHFMVGIREEQFFRGFHTMRSEKYLNPGSSVVITSIYFAMSHFTYIFYSSNVLLDILPAIIWTLGAFYVGSVSSVFIIKKRMIWPIIIAHFLNNVISVTVLWLYTTQNIVFWDLAKIIYLPLLGITLILAIVFFKEVKSGVKAFFNTFKSYKTELPDKKTRGNVIVADIIFGLVFWAIGMFFV